jgi:hypothetical protein
MCQELLLLFLEMALCQMQDKDDVCIRKCAHARTHIRNERHVTYLL